FGNSRVVGEQGRIVGRGELSHLAAPDEQFLAGSAKELLNQCCDLLHIRDFPAAEGLGNPPCRCWSWASRSALRWSWGSCIAAVFGRSEPAMLLYRAAPRLAASRKL